MVVHRQNSDRLGGDDLADSSTTLVKSISLEPLLRVFKFVPGVLLLLAIGLAGKTVAGYIPHTEYVLFAIAFGALVSNLITVPAVFLPGLRTYEFWLKSGIVLMGANLAIQNVLQIGLTGLLLVITEMVIAITTARLLARGFHLSDRLGSLIGIGVGICGVSAIIGATGAIDADEEDATYAIATILIFGAIMVFLYPLLGSVIGMTDQVFGFWTGLSVDNTAEAVATGFAFSEGAGNISTVVKLSRNSLMGVVILAFALVYAKKGLTKEIEHKGRFVWERFPKFVLGFLLLSVLASMGFFSPAQVQNLTNLSRWAFLLSFAGVGMSLQLTKMRAGIRPFLVGLGVEAVVALITLGMVMTFVH